MYLKNCDLFGRSNPTIIKVIVKKNSNNDNHSSELGILGVMFCHLYRPISNQKLQKHTLITSCLRSRWDGPDLPGIVSPEEDIFTFVCEVFCSILLMLLWAIVEQLKVSGRIRPERVHSDWQYIWKPQILYLISHKPPADRICLFHALAQSSSQIYLHSPGAGNIPVCGCGAVWSKPVSAGRLTRLSRRSLNRTRT